MVLLKLNLIKDGYGLTVTEIKDFMSSLAENYDSVLFTYWARPSSYFIVGRLAGNVSVT